MSTDAPIPITSNPERSELERKNERLQLLLNLTNRITSNLEFRELLRSISANIREVMQCDAVAITLPDVASGRLRAALWRQWKTPRRRRAALLKLGVSPRLARNTASSGRGPWPLARTKALTVGLSNAYFRSLGLPTLVDECSVTVSNRGVRTRTHGGVAGVGG
jgi:hypothetical protein